MNPLAPHGFFIRTALAALSWLAHMHGALADAAEFFSFRPRACPPNSIRLATRANIGRLHPTFIQRPLVLWLAASDPAHAYKERRAVPSWLPSDSGLTFHMMVMGTTGHGMSMFVPRMSAHLLHPADHALAIEPWPIGCDESLDSCHPMLIRGWLARAQQAQHSLAEDMAWSLARSMAGQADSDGLPSHIAAGIETSLWGQGKGLSMCQRALPLLERIELDKSCSPGAASTRQRL